MGTTTTANVTSWGPDRREIMLTRTPQARVLVVPESVNRGWVAKNPEGATLTPIIVNGWQQGWVIPAGEEGPITLTFPSNTPYRIGLLAGLSLLPILLLLLLVPARRVPVSRGNQRQDPASPRAPRAVAVAGLLLAGTVIAGWGGAFAFGGVLLAGHLLRDRPQLRDRLTIAATSFGLIVAGALLSRYPWRSVDGYIGHSAWVQLPALISIGVLGASVLVVRPRTDKTNEDPDAQE